MDSVFLSLCLFALFCNNVAVIFSFEQLSMLCHFFPKTQPSNAQLRSFCMDTGSLCAKPAWYCSLFEPNKLIGEANRVFGKEEKELSKGLAVVFERRNGEFDPLAWHAYLGLLAQVSGAVLVLVMLHVRALSGATVAELHVEELTGRLEESESLLVVALKRKLGAQLGCSRFRLKLLGEDNKEMHDDIPLTGPADLALVRMDFQSLDAATTASLISACKGGRVSEVEHLLRAPQNPDARDAQNNCTGILEAARNGHLAIVQLLLDAGADKEVARQDGATALHVAAQNGHLDVVRLLLEAGADKDVARQNGATVLQTAAYNGHSDVVRLLLEGGAEKDAARQTGATALHIAAQNGHVDVARLLLEAGADKDAAMHNGATALYIAAQNGHSDVVRLLLEAGAEKEAARQTGTTALHVAAQYGHVDVARLLLEAGANKNAAMQDGKTALHVAAQNGHVDVARMLLEAGADKTAAMQDGTALHLASQFGHTDVARLLLEAGADKEAMREDGATALHLAAEEGHLDVVELLRPPGAAGAAGHVPKRARFGD